MHYLFAHNIVGLVQTKRNSIASALEFSLSCTNPSICAIEISVSMDTRIYYGLLSARACLICPEVDQDLEQ